MICNKILIITKKKPDKTDTIAHWSSWHANRALQKVNTITKRERKKKKKLWGGGGAAGAAGAIFEADSHAEENATADWEAAPD